MTTTVAAMFCAFSVRRRRRGAISTGQAAGHLAADDSDSPDYCLVTAVANDFELGARYQGTRKRYAADRLDSLLDRILAG